MQTMPWRFVLMLVLAGMIWGCVTVQGQGIDPTFKPELVGVDFTAREIRPGDPFAMTIKFRNAGSKPAKSEYRVFLHFEAPEQTCENIVIHGDHDPTVPTTMWEPGKIVADGPRILSAPTDQPEQEYFVHIGLFDHAGGGDRLLDTYDGGKIKVTSEAPASDSAAPEPLSDAQISARREALAQRIPADRALSLDSANWALTVDEDSGAWSLTDKRTGVLWASAPDRPRFAQVHLRNGDRRTIWRVDKFDTARRVDDGIELVTRARVDGRPCGVTVTFRFTPMSDPDGLRLSYTSTSTRGWEVARVRVLDDALWTTDADEGCVYVPQRLGIELPATKGLPGRQQWTTYNNITMAMCGAVKQGSAILVNWENVDSHLGVETSWPDLPLVPGRRARALTLDIDAPSASCTIHPLGEGGYVEIARAYRPLAKAKGWLIPWSEKRKQDPKVDRIFGAANFKPFVFSRVVPSSRFAVDGKERTHLGFTFDEVAQCAEHWRNDLGIDRAYVVMAGWINGGYDVRHPDPLPAAPECGGNEGMKAAFDRIKACGYLVGGHDNYQDMYKDAPSWNEAYINKDSRGRPKRGGNWNGGQAWQLCAIKQVEMAAREKTNLPEIQRLFEPTIFFIDTVFAWPLVTCEDPDHPMTRQDDLDWKTKLCLLSKKHCGLFGSEEGREWAVACADYLEGIFGHQTDSRPGEVIPLFPLVYSDCVQIMTHQGNRISAGDEKKVADHILFAEMGLPAFGQHLYWQGPQRGSVPVVPLEPRVRDLGDRKFEITYRWEVRGQVEADYRVFVHFTHPAADHPEKIAYQNDHVPVPGTSQWQTEILEDGPYTVEVPEEYNGVSEIRVGMTNGGRAQLSNAANEGGRYLVGSLKVSADGIEYIPAPAMQRTDIWARADGGWGEDLGVTDRVIKNTWEVLSPLNLITAETPMTSHEFLTEDRLVQRTRFGDVTITVAYEKPAVIGDDAVPAYGFIVQSPEYIAFCATRYAGIDYDTPVLFTARSLDGKPIAESSQVRIYHGFGDTHIKLAGKVFEVDREEIVSVK